MKEELLLKANSIREKMLYYENIVYRLKYSISEIEYDGRDDFTLSVDDYFDIHSIPITKTQLITHLKKQLEYYEREYNNERLKLEKI